VDRATRDRPALHGGTMTLTALCSFFDEQPETLHRMIASLPKAGITHLVALDGRYALFPSSRNQSRTHHKPSRTPQRRAQASPNAAATRPPVQGGEIEKRTHLFELGETVTPPTRGTSSPTPTKRSPKPPTTSTSA
jgi:hypothetical protein